MRKYAVGIPGARHITGIYSNRDKAEVALRSIMGKGGKGYAIWCIHNTPGQPRYEPPKVICPVRQEPWWKKFVRKIGI